MRIKKKYLVSVVIPARNFSDFFKYESLPCFEVQSSKNFEVIIITPSRENGTLLIKKYPWLRIIKSVKTDSPPKMRNKAVSRARGEIIAFIDDDAIPAKNWIERGVSLLNKRSIDALCGPGILPTNATFTEVIINCALNSFICAGGMTYRFRQEKSRFVDDFPTMNLFIKRSVFNKLKGFTSNYHPGEDSKLCQDLVYKMGGKILYHPDIFVYHHRRKSLKNHLIQYFQYGFNRGMFFAHKDENSRRLFYPLPALFLIYLLISLPLIYFIEWKVSSIYLFIIILPFAIYILSLFIFAINNLIQKKNILLAFFAGLLIFITHLCYGVGFIVGFLREQGPDS